MCFTDVLTALRADGPDINGTQQRCAINSGKIARPKMDGSLSFVFDRRQVDELRSDFRTRQSRRQRHTRQVNR
jgi:hypothetical protein